jgi:hypothetical protein
MSRRLALLIGNVRYQDGRLHSPISGKTFTALADVLEDPHSGRFDEVFVLLNKPAVEVQLAIAEFFEESRSPDDFLLIYFAGHALHHQGKPYLACWDTFTESYLDATTVQAEYVKRRFSMHQAKQKAVILDCTVTSLLDGDSLPEEKGWLQRAFQGAGMTVLAAVQPYNPTEPSAHSSFTPTLIEALRSDELRLHGAELATAVARFNQIQSPPQPEPQSEPVEAETPPAEAEPPLEAEAELETGPVLETAVVDTPVAEETVLETAVEDTPVVEEAVIETAVTETPVMPETADVPTIPTPNRSYRRYAIPALVILLLLLAAGSLYGSGFFEQTAVSPTIAATSAAIALEPTRTPTKPATGTAAPTSSSTPTLTPTTTSTPAPAISPSPITSSPQPLITSSPVPLNLQIARQLVYLRGGPAINFRIVDYLTEGTAITVLGRTESGDWYNVQLADGRTGWLYNEMAEPPAGVDVNDIPIVATIPVPVNEFHDFVAQPTDDELIVSVGHVYVGKQGPATLRAELLPETSLIQATYEDGQELGLGRMVVRFARVGEGAYVSTAVRLCMIDTAGTEFLCETFSVRKEW